MIDSHQETISAEIAVSDPSSDKHATRYDESGQNSGSRSLVPWLVSVLIAASAILVLWNLQDSSRKNANTGSRYATIESLVDYGSYYIDKSVYRDTIDKFKVGKHLLSSKPPLLPTYAAGVYWTYEKITGKTIVTNEGEAVWLVSLFTGWLAHVIFLIYLYLFTRLLIQRQLAILVTMAVGGFAYLGAAYATTINNHSIAATLGFVGFYYAFRIRNQRDAKLRHWFLSGVLFGILPAIDLPSLAFSFFVGVYLVTYDWRKTLLIFVPCMLPGLAAQLGISYYTTGSFKPAYGNAELKAFSANYFRNVKGGIDALHEPKYVYAFNVLLGHHGLFSMTPLFAFSVFEMLRSWRHRERFFPELAVVTATVLVITTFYISRTHNYGGWCVGMRWLIPIMPLLLLYFALWLDRTRLTRLKWAGVLAAFMVSQFNTLDGLSNPFQFSLWHNWLEHAPNRNRLGSKMNLRHGKRSPSSTLGQDPEDDQ